MTTGASRGCSRWTRPQLWGMLLWLLTACLVGCRAGDDTSRAPAESPTQPSDDAPRQMMVRRQIRARGVKDERVLGAMERVPRHEFVPAAQRPYAYEDRPLPIGKGQTISQPYIVALMTELLEVEEGDKVLEIGTGSGYQAAILAELTPHVYTIEIITSLAERAEETLRRLGYETVQVKAGDGYLGWPEHAPFDGIIVTCAPEEVPEALAHQTLYVLRKSEGRLRQKEVIPVRFVPMVHG